MLTYKQENERVRNKKALTLQPVRVRRYQYQLFTAEQGDEEDPALIYRKTIELENMDKHDREQETNPRLRSEGQNSPMKKGGPGAGWGCPYFSTE